MKHGVACGRKLSACQSRCKNDQNFHLLPLEVWIVIESCYSLVIFLSVNIRPAARGVARH